MHIRRNLLRLIYAACFVLYTIYAYWFITVGMPSSPAFPVMPSDFKAMMYAAAVPAYAIVAAPLAVLAVRPMWWGKLLMLLFLLGGGMAWLELRLVSSFGPGLPTQIVEQFRVAARFAYVFAGLAIVQQVIDPTVWRPTRTWLSKDCPPPWPFGRKRST